MTTTTTRAEQLVRTKDELNRKITDIESWLRSMRLGERPRLRTVTRYICLPGDRSDDQLLPHEVQVEFYDFLQHRVTTMSEKVRAIDEALAGVAR